MPVLKLAQLSPAPRSAFTTSRCATASKLSAWFCHHSRNWKSRKLDELGISRIEAGFPKVSPEDGEAITLMHKADLKAELWGFSRAVRGDVEELVRVGLSATVIESPTSDQIEGLRPLPRGSAQARDGRGQLRQAEWDYSRVFRRGWDSHRTRFLEVSLSCGARCGRQRNCRRR
jgi:hypothetical protein